MSCTSLSKEELFAQLETQMLKVQSEVKEVSSKVQSVSGHASQLKSDLQSMSDEVRSVRSDLNAHVDESQKRMENEFQQIQKVNCESHS